MAAINNIVLNTEAEALEHLLSPFIKEQFPLFMQTDYPKLVLFIKAYYEWMEQEGNVGYLTSKMDTIWDVDRNLEEFYSHFKNTYLDSFPELFAVNDSGNKPNKKTLLKKIRDFYGNKGTESAYKFLFRILYDSDLEFYYPKNDILKASDGVWVEPRSIKTTVVNGTDLFGGKGGEIYQYEGQQLVASAFINSVVQYAFNGVPISEFFITDINGTFLPNRTVKIVKEGSEWSETAYPVIGEFFIELPGEGYRIGDAVTVVDSTGKGFSAKIDQVGLAGGVKKIGISNSGVNYSGDIVVNIFSETGSQTARVVGLRSAVTQYPGYFSGNRGKASSNKKIQDGHYYQDFSYELKSAVSLDTYFGVLKDIIHPAGMRMFGSILVKKAIDNQLTSSSQATFYEIPLIGRYTPYNIGTTLDLRANGVTLSGYWLGATGDLYPLGYNPYIGSTTEVGPNGTTTSLGTVFVGTSLGYTYCYVPEGGRTAHNPIGAPLGSTSAFYRNKESSLDPTGMDGLVLWLKPENIGVCGSVVNGASMDVWRDASPSRNDAIPPTWDRWTDVPAYAGVTIDKLRPTLVINDNGVAGATGIAFNTGTLYSPWTNWTQGGKTFGGAGITFGPGTTGDKINTARHFYLKSGLTLSADMDLFIVFRVIDGTSQYNYGFVGSHRKASDQFFTNREDPIIHCRSWNANDRNPANQNSASYLIDGNQKRYYNSSSAFLFRPWGAYDTTTIPVSQRQSIGYDPHVSGPSMGIIIGEAARDTQNTLYAWYNGDRARNYSPSTGLRISAETSPYLALSETPVSGVTVGIGRFGGYIKTTASITNTTVGSDAWVSGATSAFNYGFYGVLNEVIVFNRKLQETERQEVYGYLSRKYKLDTKLPDAYQSTHPSAYGMGLTYWNIEHHPNTKGITGLQAGVSFGNIVLQNFFSFPDSLYKSEGTVLSDGTVLTGDTYSNVGL
jgi:hypothetical protein